MKYCDAFAFMHSVREGPASQSYGLQVTQLAGVPRTIIDDARKKLRELENSAVAREEPNAASQQLPLLSELPPHPALIALEQVTPDDLSPREALEILYRLRGLLGAQQ